MALFLTSGPKSGSFVSMCCNFQQHRSPFFLLLMIGFAMQNIEVTSLLKDVLWTTWSFFSGWNNIVILWMVELWTSMCLEPWLCLTVIKCLFLTKALRKLCSCSRNYNPVERRSKGCKERVSKGSNKPSKSLQANRLSGADPTDGGAESIWSLIKCLSN